jgi:hypothetical protein
MRTEKILYNKGYRITNCGSILNHKGVEINGYKNQKGYISISIKVDGNPKKCPAHRLQAYQKYGDKLYEDGLEVRHKNGIKTDNSWDNILIGTHKENMMDIPEHIRIAIATYASSFNKKHDKEAIIKWHNENGKSYKKTMEHFNISSKGTLHFILNKI